MNRYQSFGIKRMAQAGQEGGKTSDVAIQAAAKVLSSEEKERIRVLILVTQEPDFLFPSTAFILQKELQLSKYSIVYDINAGTDGFLTALELSAGLLLPFENQAEALVIAADHQRAVAVVSGMEKERDAQFYHQSNPEHWDLVWGDRWSDLYDVQKNKFYKVFQKAYLLHKERWEERDRDCTIIPQLILNEREFEDSVLWIPMEMLKCVRENPKEIVSCVCMGCGAGGSVSEAFITVRNGVIL